MLRDEADSAKDRHDDPYEAIDEDEGTADEMDDYDEIFELIMAATAGGGRPESSWDAMVENLSCFREGRA